MSVILGDLRLGGGVSPVKSTLRWEEECTGRNCQVDHAPEIPGTRLAPRNLVELFIPHVFAFVQCDIFMEAMRIMHGAAGVGGLDLEIVFLGGADQSAARRAGSASGLLPPQ